MVVFFNLTKKGKQLFSGIHLADSVCLDTHKSLFLPSGSPSCFLVKNRQVLPRLFSVDTVDQPFTAAQITKASTDYIVDWAEIGPEQSREFRGLRVWLPLKLLGIKPFLEVLESRLALAEYLGVEIKKLEQEIFYRMGTTWQIELFSPPVLSILSFRLKLVSPTLPHEQQLVLEKSVNQQVIDLINSKQRVWITPTLLRGNHVIRVCILSVWVKKENVDNLLEDLKLSLKELDKVPTPQAKPDFKSNL